MMHHTLTTLRTLRASTNIAKNNPTRALYTTRNKTKPITTIPTAPIKPIEHDAGNYLTGASTLSMGDALFLLVGGSAVYWVAKKAVEEVKSVALPGWMGVGKDEGEEK